jgi:hypothetical protein
MLQQFDTLIPNDFRRAKSSFTNFSEMDADMSIGWSQRRVWPSKIGIQHTFLSPIFCLRKVKKRKSTLFSLENSVSESRGKKLKSRGVSRDKLKKETT